MQIRFHQLDALIWALEGRGEAESSTNIIAAGEQEDEMQGRSDCGSLICLLEIMH